MEEAFLYRQIAETVRRQILQGALKPGDRLPSLREMMAQWNCTIGTVQRAYQELVRQGLITSRVGQGTRVVEKLPTTSETPLRKAALIHRAETFLLEVITAGYSPSDVEEAVRQALDRWRVVEREASQPATQTLRFIGSHDLAMAWVASHFSEISPGYTLQLSFTGSLGGLIALVEGKADLAGSHLWDEESDTYNTAYVRRLLPGKRVALVTLAFRRLGLILSGGNPYGVQTLNDLTRPGLRFVNRQSGSGTRVWLDASLRKLHVDQQGIQGYNNEKPTHLEVARDVAEDQADVGLGLEASARAFGLEFIPLVKERYDLIIPETNVEIVPVSALVSWLSSGSAREAIESLAGYDCSNTGKLEWVE